jgi:hypothetical protein
LEDISINLWNINKNLSKSIENAYAIRRNESIENDNEYEDALRTDERDSTQRIYMKLVEEIMAECGDIILRIFHSNNLTYSNGMNFENLLEIIQKNNDQESLKIMNTVIFFNL